MSATELGQPFADAVDLYRERGWSSPIPLGNPGERACKAPVPKKTTGHDARVPTDRVIESWKRSHADNNIGLHLADALGVIGLDVDDYTTPSGKVKSGGKTLAELEAELGPLPPTFKVTSRGPGVSGIMVFRVPPGFEYVTKLPGIDVIQAKHRYMAVWPSVHPDTGEIYYWYSLDGRKLKRPPAIEDVPELPKAWLEYLLSAAARGLDKSAEASDDDVRAWLRAHAGSVCRAVRNVCAAEVAELSEADAGSRYDAMVAGVMALVRLGTEGHTGVKSALATLRTEYAEAVGTDREPEAIGGEWRRSVIGAVAAVMDAPEVATHGRKCPDREPERDQGEDELWPSPTAPRRVAQRLADELWTHDGHRTLACWREDFWLWTGTAWRLVKPADLRARAWTVLDDVQYAGADEAKDWTPNKARVANVLEGLASVAHRDSDREVDTGDADTALIPFANGVLRLNRATGERELLAHSPTLFNVYSLPFPFDEDAPAPKRWLRFLESLEIEDDVIELIQEWIGYVVSGDLSKNKMMYLFGDTRTGKGVITRTLQHLVGVENTASPNLAQLGETFGLAGTIGKTLITINDARFRGVKTAELVERLLNLTGEDDMQINRKNRPVWEGRPSARVMIVSNDLPSITGEQSTAFAKRIIGPVKLHRSFFGIEDELLERKLRAELPAILMWAFDGYDRLCEQGHFTVPVSSARLHRELERSMSPVLIFLDERCVLGPDERVAKDRLYAAYRSWCEDTGTWRASAIEFGRQLVGCGVELGSTKVQTGTASGGGRINGWRGIGLRERGIGL